MSTKTTQLSIEEIQARIDKGEYLSGIGNTITHEPTPDFSVDNHGSIFILTGLSESCREWIEENVNYESWQSWGRNGICIDHHYIFDLVQGLLNEGLIIAQ